MALPGRELLLDVFKGAVLTLALFLSYVTFPVFGLVPGIFTSLPGIYCYLKRGRTAGAAVVILTSIVLLFLGDPSVPLLYLLQSGLISLLLPLFYLQAKGTARAIAWAAGINFLLIVILATAYGSLSGVDLQQVIVKGIESSTTQAIAVYVKQGVKGDDIKLLTEGIQQVGQLTVRLFPALLLVALGSIAGLNMATMFRFSGRLLPTLQKPENFQSFKNPDLLVWVVISAGFAMLLPEPDINRVALNLLLVMSFIYFLQGLAVVLAFFQRISVPAFPRFFFWLILAIQPYLVLAIAILGIFDTWGDFRTPKNKNL